MLTMEIPKLRMVTWLLGIASLAFFAAVGTAQPAAAKIKPGSTYAISPAGNRDQVLFVKDASPSSGAQVVLWSETCVPAGRWRASKNDDGTFLFVNVYTGKYLSFAGDAYGGGTAFVQDSACSARTCWTLASTPEQKDTYIIMCDGDTARTDENGGNAWTFTEKEAAVELNAAVRDEMVEAWLRHHVRDRGDGMLSLGDGGWWGDAEMFETLLDAYETTGNGRYLDVFTRAFNYFYDNVGDNWLHLVYTDRYKWVGHDFNDDVMWMVIASARAYHLTGIERYRRLARKNFDTVCKRAYNRWGMLRWAMKSGHPDGTNSCINGPAEVAACYIALSLDNEDERRSYFDFARRLYEKQRKYLYVEATGQVLDCFTWDAATNKPGNYNRWVSTYNQGTMLGAAIMLYNRYGDDQYRRDADKIVECTRRELCDGDGIIKVCQTVDGDLCGFKGILMRYLRRYVVEMRHPELVPWIADNAFRAFNNRNAAGVTSSAWLTKSPDNWRSPFEKDKDGNPKNFFNQAFGNSTAVSAAVNTPLRPEAIVKNAYSGVDAKCFDYLCGAFTDSGNEGVCVLRGNGNGQYIGYANVDFGLRPASELRLGACLVGNGEAVMEVRIDASDGELIGTANIPASRKCKTLKAKVRPVTGMHRVFLVIRDDSDFEGEVRLREFSFKPGK